MHFCRVTSTLLLVTLNGILLFGQHAVDPSNRYYRIIALVHLNGSGKGNDPIIPEYVAQGVATAAASAAASIATKGIAKGAEGTTATGASTAHDAAPPKQTDDPSQPKAPDLSAARPGIISWRMELTDDKNMAIIHLVAVDHSAFDAILADKRSDVKVFELGKDNKDTIEKEMQKHKKDFSLDNFQVVAR